MLANDFGENIPHLCSFALYHFLGGFNRCGETTTLQLTENKRLEEFECHFLRQSALVQTQRRSDHNNRAARIIYALAKQVLTEAALLAFNHIGERFERTLVRARNRASATAVVEQSIYRFLQHALLISHDDVRRVEIKQTLETVVAVNHATIKVVEVRGRKSTAI